MRFYCIWTNVSCKCWWRLCRYFLLLTHDLSVHVSSPIRPQAMAAFCVFEVVNTMCANALQQYWWYCKNSLRLWKNRQPTITHGMIHTVYSWVNIAIVTSICSSHGMIWCISYLTIITLTSTCPQRLCINNAIDMMMTIMLFFFCCLPMMCQFMHPIQSDHIRWLHSVSYPLSIECVHVEIQG